MREMQPPAPAQVAAEAVLGEIRTVVAASAITASTDLTRIIFRIVLTPSETASVCDGPIIRRHRYPLPTKPLP
ncbi:hypothetical protein GCM10022235_83570 [Kribbella ginsengisoli]|uniref:Uncharacterized protein n=1 Tax=Kribbella ginsengisoli TaxID=363865 RepID=A0ABP6Z574_9ACTN